jgi:hypothetical protein
MEYLKFPFCSSSSEMAIWSSSPTSIHLYEPSASLRVSVRISGAPPFVSASLLASD